jgi:hypothetical protein
MNKLLRALGFATVRIVAATLVTAIANGYRLVWL